MHRFTVLFLIVFTPVLLFSAPAHKRSRHKVAANHKVATKKISGPLTIIPDVSVVDVVSGSVTPHQDVLIRGERIVDIRKADIRKAAGGEKHTRYVIPGLWDMHVHLWYPQNQFPLYVANGVTGVRNMGADLTRVRQWQKEIAKGELIGPRIFTAGAAIATSSPKNASRFPVTLVHTPADARKAFDSFYNQAVDFIDVIDMPEAAFEALAEASRHDGIPMAGHLPDSVSAFTAVQDRMTSMEHLFGIALACSSKESELRNRKILARDQKDWEAAAKIAGETLDTYDPIVAKRLFDDFRRFSVRQTPTLTLWSRMNYVDAKHWKSEPELRFVSDSIRKDWKQPEDESKEMPERDRALMKRQYDFALKVTGAMAKAGVPILAGTDTGDPWTVPGAELHKELALLVKAGLSPAQALRSATTEPASLMRKSDDLGQVKKGFYADLVVLDANPLNDIANTKKIHAVVLRGKQLEPAGLLKASK